MKDKQEFKLKSYFYLLRSLLSCNWIVQNDAVLPMHMEGLMEYIDETHKQIIRNLISLKTGVGEDYLHNKENLLYSIVLDLFAVTKSKGNSLKVNRNDYSYLNHFFITQLYEANNR